MKQYFISKSTPQYRANLHSHSTLSDGDFTPETLKDAVEYARVNGLRVLWIYKNGQFQPFSI